MPSAAALRLQIESALSRRIPAALTPAPRVIRPTAPTGIAALDERLGGGLPVGALTELTGPECSGRTSLALSFLAGLTGEGRVCAWVDVSNALDPESAAAIGVDLDRLLWVRCGREAQQLALPGLEAALKIPENSLSSAAVLPNVSIADTNFRPDRDESPQSFAPRCAEPQPRVISKRREAIPVSVPESPAAAKRLPAVRKDHWARLDQALHVTDLLLQAGGFSAIVLDMGSVAPAFALRIPLATWFRYRAAAERTQASVLLLTQQACTKSSAGLVLTLAPSGILSEGSTVLTGAEHSVEIARERFAQNFAPMRKPPQSEHSVRWQSHAAWADYRGSSDPAAAQRAQNRGRR
jgi:recombination protein RecA